MEKRAVQMLLMIALLFFAFHVPALYANAYHWFGGEDEHFKQFYYVLLDVGNMLINLNSSINPLFYILFTNRLRNRFWEQLQVVFGTS